VLEFSPPLRGPDSGGVLAVLPPSSSTSWDPPHFLRGPNGPHHPVSRLRRVGLFGCPCSPFCLLGTGWSGNVLSFSPFGSVVAHPVRLSHDGEGPSPLMRVFTVCLRNLSFGDLNPLIPLVFSVYLDFLTLFLL